MDTLGWRAIFFVNVPIGIAAYLHLGSIGAFLAALREAYLAAVLVSLVATAACLWTKLPRQE